MGIPKNIRIFQDTLRSAQSGRYETKEGWVELGRTQEELSTAYVFSAKEVLKRVRNPRVTNYAGSRCRVEVVDMDSFYAARELLGKDCFSTAGKPPLVLNFANPYEPGGGVKRGARAQEESLCRRSTLYLSLSSRAAKLYYLENKAGRKGFFEHNAILSPHVLVFKDAEGKPLPEPFEVAVLTMAAPYVPDLGDVSAHELRACLYTRIRGMLLLAASEGYVRLVLGAWGCGAFGNDPHMVAETFRNALKGVPVTRGRDDGEVDQPTYNTLLRHVRFAVIGGGSNFEVFRDELGSIHEDEDREEERRVEERRRESEEASLDKIQGSLVGGAVGDALGYPVEFMSYRSIQNTFGAEGIRGYWLEKTGGTALFSDDTQMTLFTAAGLLEGETRMRLRGIAGEPAMYIYRAYLDWLHTQESRYTGNPGASWLVSVDELYSCRAPGNTCLSALKSGEMGTMDHALNDSKGCGGVMRVAPVGLFAHKLDDVVRHAAAAAAITHSHPMGYIPAGALAYIVKECVFGEKRELAAIVEDCAEQLPGWFPEQEGYAKDMAGQLRSALQLVTDETRRSMPDHDNVVRLGEGWVGDEALAMAVYCCLRHPDSFSEAVIAAVNHGGDSDSTGAIAGNIMGAHLGLEAIGPEWTEHLELRELILEVGKDLCDGCVMETFGHYRDDRWLAKWGGSSMGTLSMNDILNGNVD